jgi:hypothetical protein
MLKSHLEDDLTQKFGLEIRKNYEGTLKAKCDERLSLMTRAYDQFITNTKRFGLIHRLKSIKINILDLLALYGVFRHYYRFANENALYEKWSYIPNEGDGIIWSVTPKERDKAYEEEKKKIKVIPNKYKLGFVGTLTEGNIRHEVDIRGFVLEDIHKVEIDHEKLPYIRRIKIEDIEDFPGDTPELATFNAVYPKILKEWDFLIEDLRFGTYHPYSRSDIDYTNIINKERSLNFEKVGRTKPSKIGNYAAFDLEALKASGNWKYWGRRNYWDDYPEYKNPYPTLSTIGLSRFITDIVKLRATQSEIADKYLSYWVWDTSREDEPFTTLLGKEEQKR